MASRWAMQSHLICRQESNLINAMNSSQFCGGGTSKMRLMDASACSSIPEMVQIKCIRFKVFVSELCRRDSNEKVLGE